MRAAEQSEAHAAACGASKGLDTCGFMERVVVQLAAVSQAGRRRCQEALRACARCDRRLHVCRWLPHINTAGRSAALSDAGRVDELPTWSR